jgi:TolB-like protein
MIATAEPSAVTTAAVQDAKSQGTATDLSRPAVLAQLDKILSSPTFVRSKRLGRFLRFTVEQCLEGRQNALKEYLVGVEVFNKMESFDPRIDSIVRVEARRLRSKLDRYYHTDGRDDTIIVQFRKGSYVPLILTRDQLRSLGYTDDFSSTGAARTVAVSKFTNLGMDAENSHFCSGVTEDVISALTKVPTLRVVAKWNGSADDVRPDFFLEGSVRKQGDRLRISSQLIDSSTNLYLWSETYERNVNDFFAVQDEIARSIALALRKEFAAARV